MKLVIGNLYKFSYSDTELVYKGKAGMWNQFTLVGKDKVWAELLNSDLELLEEVKVNINSAIKELKDQVEKLEVRLSLYQKAINSIDDFFEYANESKSDRTKVGKILYRLTKELAEQ